jgi:hypothetical protein
MRWNSDEWCKLRDAKLLEWFGGNKDAVLFMQQISAISELWDDLIDQDRDIPAAEIDDAMMTALIYLPLNPFYRQHATYLTPLMISSINNWKDANALSDGTRSQRALAYTLRNMDIQIIQAVVFITQGYVRLREVSQDIWTFFGADQDDIDIWLSGDTT